MLQLLHVPNTWRRQDLASERLKTKKKQESNWRGNLTTHLVESPEASRSPMNLKRLYLHQSGNLCRSPENTDHRLQNEPNNSFHLNCHEFWIFCQIQLFCVYFRVMVRTSETAERSKMLPSTWQSHAVLDWTPCCSWCLWLQLKVKVLLWTINGSKPGGGHLKNRWTFLCDSTCWFW